MVEITSDVYDVFHPTPAPLKELSAITISLEIWLREVMKGRTCDDALRILGSASDISRNISLKTLRPNLPTVIYDLVRKHVAELGHSLMAWLMDHRDIVFHVHYKERYHVLRNFKDFVCDYRGRIDYTRTAERMMNCDKFNLQIQFIIACTYFFEDDIRRLWPLVSSNMDWNNIDFSESPNLYYWICCLRNELDKIPVSETNNNIDEKMLNALTPRYRQSLEYFWSRIPLENRMRIAADLLEYDVQSFVRVILPKLNDQELDEFINERIYDLIRALFAYVWSDEEFILATWMLIQNIVNETAFTNLFLRMLLIHISDFMLEMEFEEYIVDVDLEFIQDCCHLCCEIWNYTPEKLKRAAVREITSNNISFSGITMRFGREYPPSEPKEFKFLYTFLSCASSEQRRTFWYGFWRHLIYGTCCADFKKIMNLCLENEDATNEFRKNQLPNSENFRDICNSYLRRADFRDLNEFISFAWPEIEAARNFKQRLLQSIFLAEQRDLYVEMLILKAKEFDEFISDTYNDINLAENFKARFVSSPLIQEDLARFSIDVAFEELMKFIDAFVKNEQTLLQIKKRILDHLKEGGTAYKSKPSVVSILSWCFGSKEEVTKFKLGYLGYKAYLLYRGPI